MAALIDRYARLVAAIVLGAERRAQLLVEDGLDESAAARLKAEVEAILQAPGNETWVARFSTSYRSARRGELPSPPAARAPSPQSSRVGILNRESGPKAT